MQIRFKNAKFGSQGFFNSLHSLDPTQRAWIEVSGAAIRENVRLVKSLLEKDCQFMAVVKADAYGHDAKFVSENAIRGGAQYLGVATLKEGIFLRSEGISVPILVLGNIYKTEDLELCLKNNLMPTISSIRECFICNNLGKKFQKKFSIHIKVDTGMSRLGFELNDFVNCFEKIIEFRNLNIDGIYSHLSSADELNSSDDKSFANIQRIKFKKLLSKLNIKKFPNIKVHIANSAGTLLGKNFHFDMVRIGLALYGYNPFLNNEQINLRPALTLKSKVSFIREIDSNIGVSYGKKFISNRKTKLAVISIGYADGISRQLSNKILLMHNGNLYPQVGAITMDQLMIDITHSQDISIGDTVILLGSERGINLSPLDWSMKIQTITWEILCGFNTRLPRVKTT